MDSTFFWEMFMETGAPEMYLFYQQAKKTEESYVSDCSGACSASQSL